MFQKTKQGWKLFLIVTKYLKEEENKMCILAKMDVELETSLHPWVSLRGGRWPSHSTFAKCFPFTINFFLFILNYDFLYFITQVTPLLTCFRFNF